MRTVFKVIKEVTESAFTLAVGGAVGVVSAVGILILDGFKCLTENLNPIITVDVSKLNLTEIINDFTHHKGDIALPVKVNLVDDNLAPCVDPLKVGLGIGVGVAATVLVAKYAYQCANQREKRQKGRDYNPLINDTSEEKGKKRFSSCC